MTAAPSRRTSSATITRPASACCARSSRSRSSRSRSASPPTSRRRTSWWSRAAAAPAWSRPPTSSASASSPATGNICSTRRSSPSPPHPAWSGAALISREGKLVGVGSLIVGDAAGTSENNPGNMFVPIDRLPPILADLLSDGRPSGPGRPWLGINAEELRGRLFVSRVTPDGPAEKAGHQARRHHRRRQRRGAAKPGRLLSQGLGAGAAGAIIAARRAAGQRGAAHRRQVDQPARSSAAEIDVLK